MLQVNFKAYGNYVTDSVYQWDINQDINIIGLSVASAPEVHFANANMERAIVRQSNLEKDVVTVTIPNSLLQSPLPIKAYIGIYEGETFKVIESLKIPVIAKERPTDYKFEDESGEIYSYNELLNRVIQLENKLDDVKFDALDEYNKLVEKVDDLENQVNNIDTVEIATGTYGGDGNNGESFPNKIEGLPFEPLEVYVYGDNIFSNMGFVWLRGKTKGLVKFSGTSYITVELNWKEDGLEWYSTTDADTQLNISGTTYYWIAKGQKNKTE